MNIIGVIRINGTPGGFLIRSFEKSEILGSKVACVCLFVIDSRFGTSENFKEIDFREIPSLERCLGFCSVIKDVSKEMQRFTTFFKREL